MTVTTEIVDGEEEEISESNYRLSPFAKICRTFSIWVFEQGMVGVGKKRRFHPAGQPISYVHYWKKVQKVLVPILWDKRHWVLGCLDFRLRTIYVYDSCIDLTSQAKVIKNMKPYSQGIPLLLQKVDFWQETEYYSDQPDPKIPWAVERVEGVPQQDNGGDCGVWVIMYAEFMMNGQRAETLRPEDMAMWRKELAYRYWSSRKE